MMHNPTPCTLHAQVRMQQRAIPPQVISWLFDFGTRQRAVGQAAIVYFDKAARRRLAQEIGHLTASYLSPLLNAYLIEGSNGDVITTGWRTARVKREPLHLEESTATHFRKVVNAAHTAYTSTKLVKV